HPRTECGLREVEVLCDLPDAPVTDLAQAHCLCLEIRIKRSSFPLCHGSLLAHLRASGGVHESGGGSPAPSVMMGPSRVGSCLRGLLVAAARRPARPSLT